MTKRKDAAMQPPKETALQYHTEEELSDMFKKLDAISDQRSGAWHESKAKKEHTDIFGETVRPGRYYFKRTIGPGFHNVVKLSQASMDRLLHAVFAGNPQLLFIAEYFQKKQMDDMRAALNKLKSPVSVRQSAENPN